MHCTGIDLPLTKLNNENKMLKNNTQFIKFYLAVVIFKSVEDLTKIGDFGNCIVASYISEPGKLVNCIHAAVAHLLFTF
jgi:hypothetical protein